MASFRSGLQIISDFSKTQAHNVLRCWSASRASSVNNQLLINELSTVSNSPASEITPTNTSSWFSFWKKSVPATNLPESSHSDKDNDVVSTPMEVAGTKSFVDGPSERMLDQQRRHHHPRQGRLQDIAEGKTLEFDKDHTSKATEAELTSEQMAFIQSLMCKSDATQSAEQNHSNQHDEFGKSEMAALGSTVVNPIGAYHTLKRINNSCVTVAQIYSHLPQARYVSNLCAASNSMAPNIYTRFYSTTRTQPENEKCKIKTCVKPKSTVYPPCNKIKAGLCKPRQRLSCAEVVCGRPICEKLEAPFPSYSECTKEFPAVLRKTECPSTVVGKPHKSCIKPKPGISYDGCNPPPRHVVTCPKKTKRAPNPYVNQDCGEIKPACDPTNKPFKSASVSSSNPMKCPSGFNITSKVEPIFRTPIRFFSSKVKDDKKGTENSKCVKTAMDCNENKEEVKACFTNVKKAKPKKKEFEASSVDCDNSKGNRCATNACLPATNERPWKLCERPASLNTWKCPQKVVKPRVRSAKKKKPKIAEVFKVCPPPEKSKEFVCACLPPKKKKCEEEEEVKEECPCPPPAIPCPCECVQKKIVIQEIVEPTPKRCVCPENCVEEVQSTCKKMPGAIEPDCDKKPLKKEVPKCEVCKK